jgi:hypothetical protein
MNLFANGCKRGRLLLLNYLRLSADNCLCFCDRLTDGFIVVGDEVSLALLDDTMAFRGEPGAQVLDPARILRVQLAAGLKRAPIGSDARAAALLCLICGVGGNPGEDARRDRQAVVVLCFLASVLRLASIVVSLPRRTFFMSASTSNGAGMTNVPVPPRFDFVASHTRGKSLLSARFLATISFYKPSLLLNWNLDFRHVLRRVTAEDHTGAF